MYRFVCEERGKEREGDLAKRINRYQNSPAPSYYRLNARRIIILNVIIRANVTEGVKSRYQ